jgi:tRNA(Arg) A34 adenosine deaminase TadA
MNRHEKMLTLAAKAGRHRGEFDMREHTVGAVAIRRDGVVVCSRNGPAPHVYPKCHAEARCLKKAGSDAILYVARVHRNGEWALAMPCQNCMRAIRRMHVRVVYYTVSPGMYEYITLVNS